MRVVTALLSTVDVHLINDVLTNMVALPTRPAALALASSEE